MSEGGVVRFPRPAPETPAGRALASPFPSTSRAHAIASGAWTADDEAAWESARGWVYERPVERDAVVLPLRDLRRAPPE